MRNTNQNPAVDYQAFPRLIATVIAVLSVVAFILPYDYLQYFAATDTYAVGSNSLYGILVSLGSAELSLFSYIPAFMPTSILGVSATISLYGFAAALLLAFLLAVCAIFSGKRAQKLASISAFVFTWGAAIYAINILLLSYYIPSLPFDLERWSMIFALVGAIAYFLLMASKLGEFAIINTVHFVLTLAYSAAILLALTYDKARISQIMENKTFEKILLSIVGVVFANLFYTSIRASFKKATFFDLCSSLVEALVALSLCAISYLSHTLDGSFVALPLAGTLIAIMQLLLVEIRERYIRKMQANAEETEQAEQAAEMVVQEEPIALPAISFGAPAREFPAYECKEEEKQDAFMQSLTEEEKKEFAALYLNKTANEMPEIPAYQAGGDNKAFFNHIFVYLGKYRENISDDLLEKLYDFSR